MAQRKPVSSCKPGSSSVLSESLKRLASPSNVNLLISFAATLLTSMAASRKKNGSKTPRA